MAIAKKAAKKTVQAAGTPGTSVPAKDTSFLLLIVFKVTHGSLFNKHSHYTTNLMKVKDNDEAKANTKAAKNAAEKMTQDVGIKTEVIISERVKAVSHEEMHAQVHANMEGLAGAIKDLVESL